MAGRRTGRWRRLDREIVDEALRQLNQSARDHFDSFMTVTDNWVEVKRSVKNGKMTVQSTRTIAYRPGGIGSEWHQFKLRHHVSETSHVGACGVVKGRALGDVNNAGRLEQEAQTILYNHITALRQERWRPPSTDAKGVQKQQQV